MAPNYIAVLVAAIVNMVIGYIWYGPLFGKVWMRLNKIDASKMKEANKYMARMYGITYLSAVVIAYVLALLMSSTGITTVMDGINFALLIWLGFIATIQLGGWVFEGKKFTAYLLDAGYWLVAMVAIGAILGAWR